MNHSTRDSTCDSTPETEQFEYTFEAIIQNLPTAQELLNTDKKLVQQREILNQMGAKGWDAYCQLPLGDGMMVVYYKRKKSQKAAPPSQSSTPVSTPEEPTVQADDRPPRGVITVHHLASLLTQNVARYNMDRVYAFLCDVNEADALAHGAHPYGFQCTTQPNHYAFRCGEWLYDHTLTLLKDRGLVCVRKEFAEGLEDWKGNAHPWAQANDIARRLRSDIPFDFFPILVMGAQGHSIRLKFDIKTREFKELTSQEIDQFGEWMECRLRPTPKRRSPEENV